MEISPIIFLSYSSRDRDFVDKLARDLTFSGVTVWYDTWAMKPGDRLREKINRGISNCRYFGIVISKRSVNSAWVKNELDAAMIRHIEDQNVEIIPILLGRIRDNEIPTDLRGLVYVDFRNLVGDKYAFQLARLTEKVSPTHYYSEPSRPDRRIRGPKGGQLYQEILKFATAKRSAPYSATEIRIAWTESFCKNNRGSLRDSVNYLLFKHYATPKAEMVMQLFHALFEIHHVHIRAIPSQILRIIDDPYYDPTVRAQAIHIAGRLEYPLGERRIGTLLSSSENSVIYAACEYLEYRVGVVDSEAIAQKLIAIVNRADESTYFTAVSSETGEEEEVDVRHYAARCLVLSELDPAVEELIVTMLRQNYPEVEDEAFSLTLNSTLLAATERKNSRLWKRYGDPMKSIFTRFDKRRESASKKRRRKKSPTKRPRKGKQRKNSAAT